MTRDLAMTGRRFDAEEAKSMGLVSRVFDDAAALEDGAMTLARELAAKFRSTMRGIKIPLITVVAVPWTKVWSVSLSGMPRC